MTNDTLQPKRFNQLTTLASRADWVATTFFAVDSASTGTKKLAASILVDILNNFAPEFNASVACVAGKCYWKDGVLYRCKTAHSGAWGTGSDFSEVNLDELKQTVAHLLGVTATDADFTATNFIAMSNASGQKKIPLNLLAKVSDVARVSASIAPAFDPTRTSENPYKVGESVMYQGELFRFKNDHYGPWSDGDVVKNDLSATASSVSFITNDEYLFAFVDNNGNFLFGVKRDGTAQWNYGIPADIKNALFSKVDKEDGKGLIIRDFASSVSFISNDEYLFAFVDGRQKIIFGVKRDGGVYPLSREIVDLQKSVDVVNDNLPKVSRIDFVTGYWNVTNSPKYMDKLPSALTYSPTYKCASVHVKKGDLLEITGMGASSARTIAVGDSADNLVNIANVNQVLQKALLRMTHDGVVKISVQSSKTYGATLYRSTDNMDDMATAIDRAFDTYLKQRKYFIEYANASNFEYFMNYTGNNQNIHPKVLNISSKFGGHKFWMAYTPYPSSQARYENPCVAYSDDGFSWTNVKNSGPIFDEYIENEQYGSDTHLVYNSSNSTLELWWRRVVQGETNSEEIYRSISSDGFDWGTPELMYSTNSGGDALSPAVMIIDGYYHMWIVNGTENFAVEHYKSNNPGPNNWTLVDSKVFEYSYESGNYFTWHIDVALLNGVYVLLSMAKDRNRSNLGDLFISTSDDGENWSTTYPVIVGDRGSRWDNGIYRSTIIYNDLINKYVIYYSALKGGLRGIGLSFSDDLTKFIGNIINNI